MTPAEPLLSIRKVAKSFGSTRVLSDIDLDVAEGEFLTILGESGSGKTTLLRILAGFEHPDSGEVWMEGGRLDTLPANRRNVNTVFQHYALFPHLSVYENVAYGLRAKRAAADEIGSRVETALGQMKMTEFASRRPAQLSGGQQQRVALARALVNRPRLLLLDEPLAALDANLRRQMQLELKTLQREVGISFVFVTHDQEEAMALSDRIALLRRGRMEQVDTPRDLYLRPKTKYAASFIGQTNLLTAKIETGIARAGPFAWACSIPASSALFCLRPEDVSVHNQVDASVGGLICQAVVVRRTFTGVSELLEADCGAGFTLTVRTRTGTVVEQDVVIEIAPEKLVLLTEEAG